VRALLLAALMVVLACAPAAAQSGIDEQDCLSVKAMTKRLIAEEGLAYLADAIDADGLVHMWFVSGHTHEWAEIVVANGSLEACVIRRGIEWHFAMGK
jgi:hypothetical protein